MPVYSDDQHGRLQRRFSRLQLSRYKSTPLWLFLACLVIGTAVAGFLIIRSFNTDNSSSELAPSSLIAKVFHNFKNSRNSLRINFFLGQSDSPTITKPSIKGKLELDKNHRPFNLEMQFLDGAFDQIQPTLKIMPSHSSHFLKMNLAGDSKPPIEPLVLMASLNPYQELTPNLQRFYQPATGNNRKLTQASLQNLNNQLISEISDATNQRWIKLDSQLVNQLTTDSPEQAINLCFFSEAVFFNYNFWDFKTQSFNQQQQKVIELDFDQAKFIKTIKNHPKHRCFSQIKSDQLRESIIDNFKDLQLSVSVDQSSFLPRTAIITKDSSAELSEAGKQSTYYGRFEFNFLPDGIDSSEPTNFVYLPQLIKQLDQKVGDFLKSP